MESENTENKDKDNFQDLEEESFFSAKITSFSSQVLKRFCRHRLGLLGVFILTVITLLSIFAPYLAPYDPTELHPIDALGGKPAAPSEKYLLGTDNLGRDILSRVLYGGRISLSVGFGAMLISLAIGIPFGCMMGYFGGILDFAGSRLIDFMSCIPSFFLILIINSLLNSNSVFNVMGVLGLFGWMGISRQVRSQFLSLRDQEFVQAAITLGIPTRRVVFSHILPHAIVPVIVSATMGVGGFIISESGLSFLGLGVQEPNASWGSMLKTAQTYMRSAPWMAIVPGTLITLTVMSFNFVGDALRDALDPRLSR